MYTRQECIQRLSDELCKANAAIANANSLMDTLLEQEAEAYAEAKYQQRIVVPMPNMKTSWDGALDRAANPHANV